MTEDRKSQGLVLGMSVRENFSLTHLETYSPLMFVNRRQETARCSEFVRALGIKTPSNEQKSAQLERRQSTEDRHRQWVARNPKILIVDEATRGIDIGAKAEVHALLARLAQDGMGSS